MKLSSRRSMFFGASIVALVVSSSALAQVEGGESGEQDDVIVVTGTNIRGARPVGSVVQSIGADAIAESGMSNIGDIMRGLPNNLAGGVGTSDELQSGQDTGAGVANLSGGQGINLRGLGALSTLVLVNGRRAPASGQFGDFVDISTLPTVAIERVEILPDGASAVYGSDAVGGVANFILRTKADAAVTTLKIGTATQGGGTEYLAGQLLPFNWSTGNLVLAGEYYRREAVKAGDREPYDQGSDFSRKGGVNWRDYTARYAPVANIFTGVPALSGTVAYTVPPGANAALTVADLIPADGVGNTVNVYDATDILPQVERYSAYAAFNQEVGEDIEIYGDARYTRRKNVSRIGYSPLVKELPSSSPYYIAGLVPGDGPIGFGTLIDDRPNTRRSTVDSYGATLGTRVGLFNDWKLDAAVTYAADNQRRVTRQIRTADLQDDVITCALAGPSGTVPGCAGLGIVPFNPFSTDPLSATQLEQYYGTEDLKFDSDVWQISGKIDGSIFELPGGAAKFAVGAEWRREAMQGHVYADTIGLVPAEGPYTRTERDAVSVFGEVQLPIIDAVTLNIAGRYEDFKAAYGSRYNDFNPKVGLDVNLGDGARVRASWGTSFHAPPMRFENDDPQPLPGGNAAFILNTTRFGPCDLTLVQYNGLISAGGQCSFSLIINAGGAGAGRLKPENAETWTVGFDYAPPSVPGFKLNLSYFNITVKDRIERIESGELDAILTEYFATNGGGPFAAALTIPTEAQAQAIIDSAKFLGTFGPPIANSAADIQMIVNATQINIAALKEEGIDFNIEYGAEVAGWDLGVFARGTYLIGYKTQAGPGLPFESQLDRYSSFGSPVKLRSQLGARFGRDWFGGALTANYVDSYKCAPGNCYVPDVGGAPVANTRPVGISAWWTFDAAFDFDLGRFGGALDGTSLVLSVNNIFDRNPPFIDGGSPNSNLHTAYDPANHTIIGRTVGLLVRKTW